MIKLIKMIFLD